MGHGRECYDALSYLNCTNSCCHDLSSQTLTDPVPGFSRNQAPKTASKRVRIFLVFSADALKIAFHGSERLNICVSKCNLINSNFAEKISSKSTKNHGSDP